MPVWIRYALAVAGALLIFGAGYQCAASTYGEKIAAIREDYANRACALEEKYREREKVQYKSLVAAWEERDAALSRVDALSRDVERVRGEADAARRRLSAISSDTEKPDRKRLERGAELVERGADLLNRCVRLAERTSIDKDAVTKIVAP